MLYLAMAAALVVLCVVAVSVWRTRRVDETDRFHLARSLTTAWSEQPVPRLTVPAEGEQPDSDGEAHPRLRPSRRDG